MNVSKHWLNYQRLLTVTGFP